VVAKRSARQARVKALTQMRHLVVSAPDQLRTRLKGLSVIALVSVASRLRPVRAGDAVLAAPLQSIDNATLGVAESAG
jgi:transposase